MSQHRRSMFAMPRQPRGKVMMSSVHDQFMSACVQRNEARFRQLVNRVRLIGSKETVNQTDAGGRTPLSHLCGHGSHRCVEDFARLKLVNVNLGDKDGNTPLHYAAQAGYAEVVEILLSKFEEIDVDARNKLGITPLIKACVTGKRKCVQLLLDKGADPEARDPRRGLTAAQWAYLCSWPTCARVLEAHALLNNPTPRLDCPKPVPNSISVPKSRHNTNSNQQSMPVPGSVIVTNSAPGTDLDSVSDPCPDSVNGFVLESISKSSPSLAPDSDSVPVPDSSSAPVPDSGSTPVPDSDSVPGRNSFPVPNSHSPDSFPCSGPELISDSIPDSDSGSSYDSRQCRLLRWYSESDLTQESPWLRKKHATITGGGVTGRRASLPDCPDIYRPIEPATWRTVPEIPAIRVLEVEAPVDPVIVQYGDPVPPNQLAVQQNQMVTLCLPGMGKGFAYE